MKKVLLPLIISIAVFAGGYAIGSMKCKCGPLCACNPCNCEK